MRLSQIWVCPIEANPLLFHFNSPEYSFVKHAASHGYSSFIYDRLGTGGSETPNSGFREAQVYTEVAIYQDIVRQLRAGKIGNKSFKRITGMGHSYGSAQTQSLSKMTPELLDGIVLTGEFRACRTLEVAFNRSDDSAFANCLTSRLFHQL